MKRKSKSATAAKPSPPFAGSISSGYYYPLWEHMYNEHGLVLLDSELNEICQIVERLKSNMKAEAPK